MDRAQNVVLLEAPHYTSTTDAGTQTVAASHAVVHTSQDGKPTAVEARGQVQLTGAGRGSIASDRMDVTLNDEGQPREGHLYGGVGFRNETPTRQEQGRAQDVRVSFDDKGRARHALMTGAVELDQTAAASSRRLEAERVDLTLSGGGKEKAVLRAAIASGAEGARLRLVDSSAKGTTATGVRADTLTGRFGAEGLTGLDGTGKTSFERVDTNLKGLPIAKETSTGDILAVDLKPAGEAARGKGRMELARAIQRGSVEIVREAVAKTPGAPPEIEHARAATGDYEADRDQLTLTGDAAVSDATSAVFADKVLLDRGTGDAFADGSVRVSYAEGKPGAEPVHVLAARAVAHKATGLTEFTAAAGGRVRMWQGGSGVEAPMVALDRNKKTMLAHGIGAADDQVATVLAAQQAKPGSKPEPPARVLSRQMTYTDSTRQVEFTGHVQVSQSDGTLHAQDAIVYLAPAAPGAKAEPAADLLGGGKVERIVGTGAVELEQPGRKATGEKLVYTAADETYVLTGTKAVPPRLNDAERGLVTGAQLRFKRGDESVQVVGADGSRVRSEPRAKQ
jgi:lipopolysaccharide export system protein LptA